MALVTTADAKLNPAINRIDDTWLASLLELASTKAEQYCGRPFPLKAYSERLDGSGKNQMFLTVTPLFAIEQVDITEIDGTVTTYDDPTDFVFNEATGEVRFVSQSVWFPAGFQNILISYVGGYYYIPGPVQDAVILIALSLAGQGSTSNDLALGTENPGDYRDGFRQTSSTRGIYSLAVANLLEQYRTIGSGLLTELEEVIGPQGPQGELTFRGPQGAQGVLGPQGLLGAQGKVGSQGTEGTQGVQGAQGRQGHVGGQGSQGWQGAQGWAGSQGWQGRMGRQGYQGGQGAQGYQGNQGEGAQGAQGTVGPQGPQGVT